MAGTERDMPDSYRRVLMQDPCVYCGEEPTGLDHIASRVSFKGTPSKNSLGINGWWNRAPACLRCEGVKAGGSLLAFLIRRLRGLPTMSRRQLARQERLRQTQRKWIRKYQRTQSGT